MPLDPILQALADVNPNLPLEPNDPRFVDLDTIRGFALRERIRRLLLAAESRELFAKIAVAGHRGAGKSTELNRVFADLNQAGYDVLWASVNDNLDPNEISFSDVMRLIVQLIDDRFGGDINKHPAVAEAFRVVLEWFKEVTKSKADQIESAKNLGLSVSVGGKAGIEFGGEAGLFGAKGSIKAKTDLGELVAAVGVVRRSETKERTEIKETLERYNSELVENVNALLRAIATANPGLKLAIILDNVDKYDSETVNKSFFKHSGLFQSLECHLVFTIQSSLLYDPKDEVPDQAFKTLPLPMLPVFLEKSRNLNDVVVKSLQDAVFLRVPRELFAEPDEVTRQAVFLSGGCWRDLLRLLEDALLGADNKVTMADLERSRDQVAQSFQRLLRSEEDLQVLAKTHLTHSLLTHDRVRQLLHHRCILAYNGKGWYDIHPLLDAYPPVAKAIKTENSIQS